MESLSDLLNVGPYMHSEGSITMVQGFSSVSTTINMLIEFRQPFTQICFVKIPSYNKYNFRIYCFQFA